MFDPTVFAQAVDLMIGGAIASRNSENAVRHVGALKPHEWMAEYATVHIGLPRGCGKTYNVARTSLDLDIHEHERAMRRFDLPLIVAPNQRQANFAISERERMSVRRGCCYVTHNDDEKKRYSQYRDQVGAVIGDDTAAINQVLISDLYRVLSPHAIKKPNFLFIWFTHQPV